MLVYARQVTEAINGDQMLEDSYGAAEGSCIVRD